MLGDLRYQGEGAKDWFYLVLTSEGAVGASYAGNTWSWLLTDEESDGVLARVTAALDDAGFPKAPEASFRPGEHGLRVELEAGDRVGRAEVPVDTRYQGGGWGELLRLLDSLLDQATEGAVQAPTQILPPCLRRV